MGRVLVQQPGTNTAKALTETLPKNVIIVDEDLKELRLHDGVTPGGKIIGQSAGSGVPIGTIIPFAGNSVPQGYLLCDGSAISRTDYASLFAVIGTIYGAGDGNSTFNLPRSHDARSLVGANTLSVGYQDDGQLPNLYGIFGTDGTYGASAFATATGCFEKLPTTMNWHNDTIVWNNPTVTSMVEFNASKYSNIYDSNATAVLPRRLQVLHCVKYI